MYYSILCLSTYLHNLSETSEKIFFCLQNLYEKNISMKSYIFIFFLQKFGVYDEINCLDNCFHFFRFSFRASTLKPLNALVYLPSIVQIL